MESSKHLFTMVTIEKVRDENFSHIDFLFAKVAKRFIRPYNETCIIILKQKIIDYKFLYV